MILFFHNNSRVLSVVNLDTNSEIKIDATSLSKSLFLLAEKFPDTFILWCNVELKNYVNYDKLTEIFHHKLIFSSFHNSTFPILSEAIGYVNENIYVNYNKTIKAPTWLMSSDVGGLHANVLLALKSKISLHSSFEYFVLSLAKQAMLIGLLCYSEPLLLLQNAPEINNKKSDHFTLFKFVKQHYKKRWVLILFLCFLKFEKKFTILPLIKSMFYNFRKLNDNLKSIEVESTLNKFVTTDLDVIIPTIGRKKYLFDVLIDFSNQTILPKNVIMIEQNPDIDSVSELDYITNQKWPFTIIHKFTHQTGACNARNIALDLIKSDWVFFADDDIRFNENFISKAFEIIKKYQNSIYTFSSLQENQKPFYETILQWDSFGTCSSFASLESVRNVKFNMKFEFGYGEDADFGLQLLKKGNDILYAPNPSLFHLKAPIGGFRTKFLHPWRDDKIQPKPSPTVILFKLIHNTKQQIDGYKVILFFKFYKIQKIKNPYKYFKSLGQQWRKSVEIANKL